MNRIDVDMCLKLRNVVAKNNDKDLHRIEDRTV